MDVPQEPSISEGFYRVISWVICLDSKVDSSHAFDDLGSHFSSERTHLNRCTVCTTPRCACHVRDEQLNMWRHVKLLFHCAAPLPKALLALKVHYEGIIMDDGSLSASAIKAQCVGMTQCSSHRLLLHGFIFYGSALLA